MIAEADHSLAISHPAESARALAGFLQKQQLQPLLHLKQPLITFDPDH